MESAAETMMETVETVKDKVRGSVIHTKEALASSASNFTSKISSAVESGKEKAASTTASLLSKL